jgi:hypothetical protein
VHRIVKPGGYWYLTVPAFNWLWSGADDHALHYRRYTHRTMAAALEGHFRIVYLTALFERLVPAFFLARTLPYAVGVRRAEATRLKAEHRPGGSAGTALLERFLAHETRCIARGRSLRIGSTLLVVAQRK